MYERAGCIIICALGNLYTAGLLLLYWFFWYGLLNKAKVETSGKRTKNLFKGEIDTYANQKLMTLNI